MAPERDTILNHEDFGDLTKKFLKISKTVSGFRDQRLHQDFGPDNFDGALSESARKTLLVSHLQMDPLLEAQKAFNYLGERYLQSGNAPLDLDDTQIQLHFKTVVKEVQKLKPYFGPGSGYPADARTQVIKTIDEFLETAKKLGVSSEIGASRG